MLAQMRTTASSIFMKGLLVLLVISFAVWGVGDIVRGGSNAHLVTVGEDTISYPEYARAVNQAERALQAQGITMPRHVLENVVLQRLVEERLVKQQMKDAGLEVNNKLLAARLRAAPAFHDLKGKFDPALFQATLQQRQLNEALFLDELAGDIRADAFTGSLGVDELNVPPAMLALYSTVGSERRDAVLFTIPASSVKVNAPDGSALKDYYEANKELLYMMPERRTLEYVTFSTKDVAALAAKNVSEEDVAERVESDPERYKGNVQMARDEFTADAAERVLDDITIAIEDALAAGETMGQAISKAGLNAQSHVLSNVAAEPEPKDTLTRTVATKGFTMLEGETSSIETTEDGKYFIVGVQSITAAEPKPFDMVKDDVAKRANARARNKALRARAEELSVALKGKSNWQEVAHEFGVSGRNVNNLKRGEKGTLDPALNEAIFEREIGEVAGPLLRDDAAQVALVTDMRFDAKPAAPDAKVRQALSKELQQEALGNYYGRLTQQYRVRVNEAMLQQIRAQEGDGA